MKATRKGIRNTEREYEMNACSKEENKETEKENSKKRIG
jgi:hypothetical protein